MRTRLINGRALDVLPRLTDGAYDLCSSTRPRRSTRSTWPKPRRLLRVGGVLAMDNALFHDKVADPTQRDAATVAIREAGRILRDNEDVVPALVPASDGLLLAVKIR